MNAELRKLKKEIKLDLAAVERLLSRSERKKRVVELVSSTRPRKSTSQLTEEIIKGFGADFTVSSIVHSLERSGKRWNPALQPLVSGVINKLRQRNPPEVVVVVAGRGSRSGVYRYNFGSK